MQRTVIAILLAISFVLQPIAAQAASDHQSRAQAYVVKGEYRAAIIEYKNALREQPDSVLLRRRLAEAYLAVQDSTAAQKELHRALKIRPDDTKSQLGMLQSYWITKDAGSIIESPLTMDQLSAGADKARLALLKGRAYLMLGDDQLARRWLTDAKRSEVNSESASMAAALLAIEDKQPEAAEAIVDNLLAQQPLNADVLELKGRLRFMAEDTTGALEVLKQLNQHYPHLAVYAGQLAELYIRQGEPEPAKAVLNPWVSNTRMPVMHYLWAQLHYQQEDFQTASHALSTVTAQAPDFAPAYLLSGASHFQLGSLTQAEDHLKRYLRADPGSVRAMRLLVATYLRQEDPTAAIELLKTSPALTEEDVPLLASLGMKALQAGDGESAEAMLQRASGMFDADSGSSRELTQLGFLSLASGDTASGVRLLEQANQMEANEQVQLQLFYTYLQQEQTETARQFAAQMVKAWPERGAGYVMTAALAEHDGNSERMEQQLRLALQKEPGSLLATHLLAVRALSSDQPLAAKALYRQALEHHPLQINLALQLYRIDRSLGRHDEALVWLESVYRQQPDDAATIRTYAAALQQHGDEAASALAISLYRKQVAARPVAEDHYNLALALARTKAFGEALEQIDQAIGLDHRVTGYPIFKAELLMSMDRHEQARRLIRQQLSRQPEHPGWLWLSAKQRLQTQDITGARKELEVLFELQPRPQVFDLLIRTLLSQGERGTARQKLELWVAENPDDAAALNTLAQLSAADADKNRVIELYRQLARLTPDDPVVLNNLAWFLMEQGELSQGLAFAQQAIALAPDNLQIQDTLQQISQRLNKQ